MVAQRNGYRRIGRIRGGREQRIERRTVVIISHKRCRVALPARKNVVGRDRGSIELRSPPDTFWRFASKFLLITGEGLAILRVEDVGLSIERNEFRRMVEVSFQHGLAEFPVPACEEHVFVPDLVDDLRRRNFVETRDAQVDELLVFTNRQECEFLIPPEFPGNLRSEGACERILFAERARDLVPQMDRGEILESVFLEANPKVFSHGNTPF